MLEAMSILTEDPDAIELIVGRIGTVGQSARYLERKLSFVRAGIQKLRSIDQMQLLADYLHVALDPDNPQPDIDKYLRSVGFHGLTALSAPL